MTLTPEVAPQVARIIEKDPAELWVHVTPDSSRRLMLAALDAIATLGFERATTREIATRAEMSPAAVYVHYAAKVDLLQEICEVAHQDLVDAVEDALRDVEGPTNRLRVFGEVFAAWHACNHTLARVAQYELWALPENRMDKIRALRSRIEKTVRDELEQGAYDEGFTVTDVRSTTLTILSLGIDLARWYTPEARISAEAIARLHGELIPRMVGAPSPTPRTPQ